MTADGPELAAAKRLLDLARDQGSVFQRVAPGEDGPLLGVWESPDHRDQIYLGGFSSGCSATRTRNSSLIVPGCLPVSARVEGGTDRVAHGRERLAHLTPTGRRLSRYPPNRLPAGRHQDRPPRRHAVITLSSAGAGPSRGTRPVAAPLYPPGR